LLHIDDFRPWIFGAGSLDNLAVVDNISFLGDHSDAKHERVRLFLAFLVPMPEPGCEP
jgi:hypothetical protein